VQPDMKFVGLALAMPADPHYVEYFLDARNHKPGTPLDFISYHFYAEPSPDETAEIQQYSFFAQADGFLKQVRYVEAIRKRLSPQTRTTIDELGVISADDSGQGDPGHVTKPIPDAYWNLAGALYAYLVGELTHIGIDVAGESQLVGFPTQYPSVSMVDWNDGKPNARFWILKLLHDNLGPGDRLVEGELSNGAAAADAYLYSLAFVTPQDERRILVVNKENRDFDVSLAGAAGGRVDYVDQTTNFHPPARATLTTDHVKVTGFFVGIVQLPPEIKSAAKKDPQ
jgi:hypothetical protein